MSKRPLSVIFLVSLVLGLLFRGDQTMLVVSGLLTGFIVTAIALRADRELWELPPFARMTILRDDVIAAFAFALVAVALVYWKLNTGAAIAGSAGFFIAGVVTLIVAAFARRRAHA